jgi:hypothetical protein
MRATCPAFLIVLMIFSYRFMNIWSILTNPDVTTLTWKYRNACERTVDRENRPDEKLDPLLLAEGSEGEIIHLSRCR